MCQQICNTLFLLFNVQHKLILLYILVNFRRFRRPYLCRSLAWEYGVTVGCLFEYIVSPSSAQSSGNGRSFPLLLIIANNCASFKCPRHVVHLLNTYHLHIPTRKQRNDQTLHLQLPRAALIGVNRYYSHLYTQFNVPIIGRWWRRPYVVSTSYTCI